MPFHNFVPVIVLGSNKWDNWKARYMGFLQHAFEFLVTFLKKLIKYTPKYSRICPKHPFYEKQMHVVESPFIWLLNCPICLNLKLTETKLWKKWAKDTGGIQRSGKNIYLLVPIMYPYLHSLSKSKKEVQNDYFLFKVLNVADLM